jgi:2-haloacid dehalogenase
MPKPFKPFQIPAHHATMLQRSCFMAAKVAVFDAYGTLFDVASAARRAASEPGREAFAACWETLSANWRERQLQYSWLRAITGAHTDFWTVTQEALDWALEASKLEDDDLRQRLLSLYWELAAFDEVPAMLAQLKQDGLSTAILSNGAPDMLAGAVYSAGIELYLDAAISVEDVGVFKPDAKVYQMVCDRFDCTPEEVFFVSSNGWDAAGASGFGFQTLWVNRAGLPRERLPWEPRWEHYDLRSVTELVKEM